MCFYKQFFFLVVFIISSLLIALLLPLVNGAGGSICMPAWIDAQVYVSDVGVIAVSFL